MNANQILSASFVVAMCYQLYSVAQTSAENCSVANYKNSELVAENVVQDSIMFNCAEQLMNNEQTIQKNANEVKYLHKPERYKLSRKGKNFIKSKETCVLHAYNDPDPKRRSVGWGHQIQPGEKLEHITQAKADELFEKDIEWVNDAINRLINNNDKRFRYTQGFIDGLGSLIYNCGERGVTLTEFYSRWQKCRYDKNSETCINTNDLNYAIAAVKTSRISAPGHVERRYDEHLLMLN